MTRWAIVTSVFLLVLRWTAAAKLGFGDAEALYVSYALHPQPSYVDHPGLVGQLARWIGDGGAPTPLQTHRFTAVASTLLPWMGVLAARATGASATAAIRCYFALALVPELSIGLFALTPDLPLAFAWLAALAFAALAARSEPASYAALAATLGAGAMAGLACLAKASGVLLALALLAASCTGALRSRWRTAAPWAAAALAALLVAPVVLWEHREGWPMLRHRLVATQTDAGISLRNVGALLGGQLLYITPPFLIGAWVAARDLFTRRSESSVDRLLWFCVLVPAVPLVVLCLWSRVAEPHWMAPAYLPLAVHIARQDLIGPRLGRVSVFTGIFITSLGWAWVNTSLPVHLLGHRYEARYDLSNDLHAWKPAIPALRETLEAIQQQTGRIPVVIGPHYIVCAQAHAALGAGVPVGCLTPAGDDFSRWLPREHWRHAPVLLLVHDDRFPLEPGALLQNHEVQSFERVPVRRGGRVVRTIVLTRLDKATGLGSTGLPGAVDGMINAGMDGFPRRMRRRASVPE